MTYKNFAHYVDSLKAFDNRLALTIRPFIKIERLTYKDLRLRAYQAAHYLSSEGVASGQRILVIGLNSPQWVELLLGAQLIGVVVVPVDVRSPIETVHKYAQRTTPKLIFRSTYLLPELDKHYETRLLEALDDLIAEQSVTPPKLDLTGQETAIIVFTSGTTAEPKGVMLSQRNILSNVSGVQQALTINPGWRLLSVLPLSHTYELTGGCLALLSAGASIFYLPRVTSLAIARGLQEYRITTILAVPQLLSLFLERIRQTANDQGRAGVLEAALQLARILPFTLRRQLFHSVHQRLGGHLDMIVTGGAPIPIAVATTWERMGVKTVQGYGLTETSPVLAVNNPEHRRLDSPGKPLSNVKLRIANNDHEIQVKGPNVFSMYWHDAAATRAAFTYDGWFRTGDIGRLDHGWLQIQGRSKFAIVLSSGLKVFPEDVELVADKHPALKAVCVVGVTQSDGEAVEAVVISERSDRTITAAIAQINAQLESFQHISIWERWPETDFPRTRLLKTDRRAVQQWANASLTAETVPVETTQTIATVDPILHILRLSLGQPKVRIKESDRLADLGLDSLRRLTVVSLIEEQLGVTIAESHLNQTTTVATLRHLVKKGAPAESPAPHPVWPFYPQVRIIGNIARETLVRCFLRLWVRQRSEGIEHLRTVTGPAIFIFNHVDGFDAPVVYKALPWRIRRRLAVAQADDVMRAHKILAFATRLGYAAFNFARVEPFTPSLEYTGRLVDQGYSIALAPEGKLSATGKLLPFKSGIGLLAVELGIPVVPMKTIGLYGTVPLHKSWPVKRSQVTVRIGQPLRFNKGTSYDQATQQLRQAMQQL
ncbi:MAG TPA: AMP-binding protein [Candidatus Saccharimonadales bacterium]|nr:AMP-binding protein [Candidatus Saccharimonadales bacterium]